MHFSTLTVSALAACVMAAPSDVNSRDLDFTVKFHGNDACSAGGPERNYDAGSCLPLGDEARGLEILRRNANCYGTSIPNQSIVS